MITRWHIRGKGAMHENSQQGALDAQRKVVDVLALGRGIVHRRRVGQRIAVVHGQVNDEALE